MGRPLCGSFLTLILKHSSFTSHFFLHLRQLLTLLVHWVQNRGCHGWRSQQLEQTAGSTHIHSVIWATNSHILCTLSGYTPALGRKGLSLRSENEVHYLVARWMWLILLSGVGLCLRQGQELILGPPDLIVGTRCHMRQTRHSTQGTNAENWLSYLQRTRPSADASGCCSINFNGALQIYELGV